MLVSDILKENKFGNLLLEKVALPSDLEFYEAARYNVFEVRGEDTTPTRTYIVYIINRKESKKLAVEFKDTDEVDSVVAKIYTQLAHYKFLPVNLDGGNLGRERDHLV